MSGYRRCTTQPKGSNFWLIKVTASRYNFLLWISRISAIWLWTLCCSIFIFFTCNKRFTIAGGTYTVMICYVMDWSQCYICLCIVSRHIRCKTDCEIYLIMFIIPLIGDNKLTSVWFWCWFELLPSWWANSTSFKGIYLCLFDPLLLGDHWSKNF